MASWWTDLIYGTTGVWELILMSSFGIGDKYGEEYIEFPERPSNSEDPETDTDKTEPTEFGWTDFVKGAISEYSCMIHNYDALSCDDAMVYDDGDSLTSLRRSD